MKNMNITFKDFIAISEAKQVGTIYHFTRLSSLMKMIPHFDMYSHFDYISFTRNYNMLDPIYKNDFTFDYKIGDKRIVRIAIDGDKLSNKYKIEPFQDLVSIKCCIKQIDIVSKDSEINEKIKKEIREKEYKGKLNFVNGVKKLKKVK